MIVSPVNLGFSVADGENVQLHFLDGDLLVRFNDWRDQAVEHRFVEALAFRWCATTSTPTPRDDSTYEVVDSAWLADEARAEGYSPNDFVHLILCFNACKVLEVISRRR